MDTETPFINLDAIPDYIDFETVHNIMEGVGISWQSDNLFFSDCDIPTQDILGDTIDSQALLEWLGLGHLLNL